MKLPAYKADEFLSKPNPSCRFILFYGPDEGMSRLRAKNFIAKRLGDKPDPFALLEIPGGAVADDKARLLDEIHTLPMGGAKEKIIYLRAVGDDATESIALALDNPSPHCFVLCEAGALAPKSALRQLFEQSDDAMALPAYEDEGRDLQQFIRQKLAASGVAANTEAVSALQGLLSGNRAMNDMELEKLFLYIHPRKTVTAEDAEACLIDSQNANLDEAVFAAFSGKAQNLAPCLAKLTQEGTAPVLLIRAASRHATRLHLVKSMARLGADLDDTVKGLRPPVFFKMVEQFKSQLRAWDETALLRVMQKLQAAEIQCKTTGLPHEDIAAQSLYSIALVASAPRKKAA